MNRLLTAALLLIAGAGLNLVAGCGSCKQEAEKPECYKWVKKKVCPQKEVVYSCPDDAHEEGEMAKKPSKKAQSKKLG